MYGILVLATLKLSSVIDDSLVFQLYFTLLVSYTVLHQVFIGCPLCIRHKVFVTCTNEVTLEDVKYYDKD